MNEHAKQLTSLRDKTAKAAKSFPADSGHRQRLDREVSALRNALARFDGDRRPISGEDAEALASLLARTQDALERQVPGTPQHTLCARRTEALTHALEARGASRPPADRP